MDTAGLACSGAWSGAVPVLWLSGVTVALPKPTLSVPTDFDNDGTLDRKDLEQLVNCLTGQGEESRLSSAEMEQLIQNVRPAGQGRGAARPQAQSSVSPSPQILEESDIDKDGTINLSEFQHVVSRSPDFARCGGLQSRPGGCSP